MSEHPRTEWNRPGAWSNLGERSNMEKPTCSTDGCERPATTRTGMCKPCASRAYRMANRERIRAYQAAWRKSHPDAVTAQRLRDKPAKARYAKGRREAIALYQKAYQSEHAVDVRAKRATHRALNVARAKIVRAAYIDAHPGKRASDHRKYYEANRERLNEASAVYYAANRGRAAERGKARRLANPLVDQERATRRKARKNGSIVSKADYAQIIIEHGMVCHICGDDIPNRSDLHFDHVIPLARGGAHSPENIRPSHSLCNMQKGSRLI